MTLFQSIVPIILVLTAAVPRGGTSTFAADTPSCPYCGLETFKNTTETDYKVTLLIGDQTTAYRCVYCAVADSIPMTGDLSIVAPSEKKSHPVTIRRVKGEWTVEPRDAVFAIAKGEHSHCHVIYRALLKAESAEPYFATEPKLLKNARTLKIADLVAEIKKGAHD